MVEVSAIRLQYLPQESMLLEEYIDELLWWKDYFAKKESDAWVTIGNYYLDITTIVQDYESLDE